MTPDQFTGASMGRDEMGGIYRTIAEIEWLLLAIVVLYEAYGGGGSEGRPAIEMAAFFYAAIIMGFRYFNFHRRESRWKLAIETWVMMAFITWSLWFTNGLDSPLLNTYLLVIITSALTLGKITTLAQLGLIAGCLIFLGDASPAHSPDWFRHVGGVIAQFLPFVLVAYITAMFSADIRFGLRKAKMMSETDELTGLLNRRGFALITDRLFAQSVRHRHAISILMIDSDNLKQVNDNHGHQAGDRLLLQLVKCIQAQLRYTDVLGRHGGDEFIAVLPETPGAGATDVAERIRAAVAGTPLAGDGKSLRVSVSIGVATYPDDGETLEALVANADQAMYAAKSDGRDRVVKFAA